MKAAVLTKYNEITYSDVPLPKYGPGQVLIRVLRASICGSDRHIFKGEFHPRTQLPLIQGHEFVGEIAEAGSDVSGWVAEDRVAVDPILFCGECPACRHGHYPACTSLGLLGIDTDGGFAEYAVADASMLYRIPESIPLDHSALIEPYSIGFHASHRCKIGTHDSVAVFGAGRIGQAVQQAAMTITDGAVFLVDVEPARLESAKQAYPGLITIDASRQDPVQSILEQTSGGVDAAFEAAADATILPGRVNPVREAIRSIRGGGRVCVLSLEDFEISLLMKELIWKEGTLIASRVSHGEYRDAIDNLAAGKLHPEALISAVLPLSETARAYKLLENGPGEYLKILLDPSR